MSIQKWSDGIVVAELADDPQFSEEIASLADELLARPAHVVLNLGGVGFLNSSNLSRLLRLRKQMLAADKRLIVAGANNQVWGVFMVTGLDNIFEFTNDVFTALAKMQMAGGV